MAAKTKTWYAWTPINYSDADGKRLTVKTGEKVTASAINLNKDQFQELIDAAVVRLQPFPPLKKNTANPISAVEFYKQRARDAEAGIDTGDFGAVLEEDLTTDEDEAE